MAKRPGRDLAVGAMFALGLIILALGIMAVGGDTGLFFSNMNHYRVVFPSANGLLLGAPVRMAGVEVGTVSNIRLPTDPGESGIDVELAVDPKYAGRVRQDSRAALRILQLLTSEKFVEIIPGSTDSDLLPEHAEIPRLQDVGVLERGEVIADNLGELTVQLKNILAPLERGEGLVGQMLQDPEFAQEGLEALGGTLENLRKLTDDLLAGQGALGKLLYDAELAAKLDDLGGAIGKLSEVADRLSRQEGALGEFLEEGGAAQLAIHDLRDSAASIKQLTARLEQDEGLLGRLLNDEEYSETLAADLTATLSNFAEISDKINRGEGSLGRLVNDAALVDGAEDVVAGVNDSKYARWLLRHYRKKGVKARGLEREVEQPSDD